MAKKALKSFKHIVVIQMAFLGDVALALPLAQVIKNYNPQAKISFVSTSKSAAIISCASAIDQIIAYDKRGARKGLDGIKKTAEFIHELECDCIISCHRSLRSTLLTILSKPHYSVGFSNSVLSILYKSRVKYDKKIHEIERNLSLIKGFADYPEIDLNNRKVELDFADEDIMQTLSSIPGAIFNGGRLVALAPGSIWATKRWKEHHFQNLIQKLREMELNCILIGSSEDKPICERIAKDADAINLAGILTIPQSMYLLSQCKLLITNDSAPTHFAGLVDCPTITIYGPTSQIFGFAPTSKNSFIAEAEGMDCRPCHIHGPNECPLKTHACMENVTPEKILDYVKQILN